MFNNPYIRSYPSIYRGVVEDNKDPNNLGRCKIRVPSVHGELTYPVDILPWARPIALSPISKERGSVNLPDVGDIVWVLFEGAEKDFPVYFGGTYATGDVEVDKNIVNFYIENDDKISYNRSSHVYDIKIGERHIRVSPDLITLKGDVCVEGDIIIKGDMIVDGDAIGEGTFVTKGDVIGAGISLRSHTHGGVETGGGTTGSPR
jgi:phage baseplate assembly protein V